MKKLESALDENAQEIKKVGAEITEVEELMKKTIDQKDLDYLRNEKAKLRDEKAKLRDEKAKLLDEKAKLRDKENKLLDEKAKLRSVVNVRNLDQLIAATKQPPKRVNEFLEKPLLGRAAETLSLRNNLEVFWNASSDLKTVLSFFNVSRSGKTMFGRVALREVQKLLGPNPKTEFEHSIKNGLNIYIDFNSGGLGDRWTDQDSPNSPSWMALRLLARGLFEITTPDFVGATQPSQEERMQLTVPEVLNRVVAAHRQQLGLAQDAPVFVLVHIDEHQVLREFLALQSSFKSHISDGKAPFEAARVFVRDAISEVVKMQLGIGNARVAVLLTGTVRFNVESPTFYRIKPLSLSFLKPSVVLEHLRQFESNKIDPHLLSKDKTIKWLRNLHSLGFLAGLLDKMDLKATSVAHAILPCQRYLDASFSHVITSKLAEESRVALLRATLLQQPLYYKQQFKGISPTDKAVTLEDLMTCGVIPFRVSSTGNILEFPAVMMRQLAFGVIPELHNICQSPVPEEGQQFELLFMQMLLIRMRYLFADQSTISFEKLFGVACQEDLSEIDAGKFGTTAILDPNNKIRLSELLDRLARAPDSELNTLVNRLALFHNSTKGLDGVVILKKKDGGYFALFVQTKRSDSPKTYAENLSTALQMLDNIQLTIGANPQVQIQPLLLIVSQQNLPKSDKETFETRSDVVFMRDEDLYHFATPMLAHIFVSPRSLR